LSSERLPNNISSVQKQEYYATNSLQDFSIATINFAY